MYQSIDRSNLLPTDQPPNRSERSFLSISVSISPASCSAPIGSRRVEAGGGLMVLMVASSRAAPFPTRTRLVARSRFHRWLTRGVDRRQCAPDAAIACVHCMGAWLSREAISVYLPIIYHSSYAVRQNHITTNMDSTPAKTPAKKMRRVQKSLALRLYLVDQRQAPLRIPHYFTSFFPSFLPFASPGWGCSPLFDL